MTPASLRHQIVLTLLACLPSALAAQAIDYQALWNRAVAFYPISEQWTPGLSEGRFEELDDQGRVTDTTLSVYKFTAGPNHEIQRFAQSVIKNGQDITAERRNSTSSQQSKQPALPFDPQVASRLSLQPEPPIQLDGRTVVPYHFQVHDKDGDGSFGTTWLDPTTGAPVRIDYTFEKMPMFVEKVAIRADFQVKDNRVETCRLEFTATGTFFMLKKTFHGLQTLKDYFYFPDRKRT